LTQKVGKLKNLNKLIKMIYEKILNQEETEEKDTEESSEEDTEESSEEDTEESSEE